ncbi:MAG: ABC transporter permease [Burkholderiaceae bacterium]
MRAISPPLAVLTQPTPDTLLLAGPWTARSMGGLQVQVDALQLPTSKKLEADASQLDALDTAGAWMLNGLVQRLHGQGANVALSGLAPSFGPLLQAATQRQLAVATAGATAPTGKGPLERIGRSTVDAAQHGIALLAFVGEVALAVAGSIAHPARIRWRPIFFNIRSAGFDALPIVAVLSFLLGVVVAYQAADQLRRYGANLFVADLVGISMLREFAPLMTAIIIAGRSGSAYAAQIGTMAVTEEVDAMRTIGIRPLELLVLPKVLALMVALPLLTVFADVLGVFGGMVMAATQLGVGFDDFLDRFSKAVSVTTLLVGVGKAPVFAAIIAMVGCFQGLRTRGGADSVGRHTTRSVVQAIFLVIVADALFSVAFSLLDL